MLYRPERLVGVVITAIEGICCSAKVISISFESVLMEAIAVAKVLGVPIVATSILLLLKLSEGSLGILSALFISVAD